MCVNEREAGVDIVKVDEFQCLRSTSKAMESAQER